MYKLSRAITIKYEEKVAKIMAMLLSDLTQDLDKVGYHIVHSNSYLWSVRAIEVLEAAVYNREVAKLDKYGEYHAEP